MINTVCVCVCVCVVFILSLEYNNRRKRVLFHSLVSAKSFRGCNICWFVEWRNKNMNRHTLETAESTSQRQLSLHPSRCASEESWIPLTSQGCKKEKQHEHWKHYSPRMPLNFWKQDVSDCSSLTCYESKLRFCCMFLFGITLDTHS